MYGNTLANSLCFRDSSRQFALRVLIDGGKLAVAYRIWAGFINLDEIRAFLKLLANDGDEFLRVVRIGGVREDVLCRIEAVGVFVATENIDSIAADAQPWAGNQALINAVAHGGIGGAGALGAHVAFRCEPSHQIIASGEGGDDGAFRN